MKTPQLQNSQLEKSSCYGKFSLCPWTGCGVTTANSFRPGGKLCCEELPLAGAAGNHPGHIRVWPLWDFPGEELLGHLGISHNMSQKLTENGAKKMALWSFSVVASSTGLV